MTSALPSPPPAFRPPADTHERSTDALAGVGVQRVVALDRLDPRTRSHAVPADTAPPGRYLAFASEDRDWLVALRDPTTHIGRGLSAHVRIDDFRVSRLHATVVQEGDRIRLIDGRSLNGTFVNGQQATWAELRDGDEIELGPVRIRYVEVL